MKKINRRKLSIILKQGKKEARQEIRENPQEELDSLLEALVAIRDCDEKAREGPFYEENIQSLNKSIYSAIRQIKKEKLLPKEYMEKYTAMADRAFAIIKQRDERPALGQVAYPNN